MAVTIVSAHHAYPDRDGQAELALVKYQDGIPALNHLSTNPAGRTASSLM